MISASVGKGAGGIGNRKPDVRAVQCLLNLSANMVQSGRATKLPLSGNLDKDTQDAIDLFQTKVMKIARSDGRVDARGSTIRRLSSALGPLPSGPFTSPAWLTAAFAEEGVKEIGGRPQNNPRILDYLATAAQLAKIDDTVAVKGPGGKTVRQKTGYKMGDIDETAWCACFVNWCLDQAG